MKQIRRPVRIEPAFDDRPAVRALFDRTAPFASAQVLTGLLPIGIACGASVGLAAWSR